MRKLKWFFICFVILILVSIVFAEKSIRMLKDGAQAYMYGYSLVLMDTTRQVTTGNGEGNIPDGMEKIKSPTNMTWLIGRIQANGTHDFSNVHRLQDQITLTPLSQWKNGEPNPGFTRSSNPSNVRSANPMAMVAAMDGAAFFWVSCGA